MRSEAPICYCLREQALIRPTYVANKNLKGAFVDQVTAPTPWRYSKLAIILHWSLALMLAAMAGVGWYMMSIEDEPDSGWLFDLHKSFGLVVLGLVIFRLFWRLRHAPEKLPSQISPLQAKLSTGLHWALYLCMLLIPLAGLIGASYSKDGVAFFGLALPRWLVSDHDTAEQYFSVHSAVVWFLVFAVVLHAAAGLKHLLFDRDGVFQRMWP